MHLQAKQRRYNQAHHDPVTTGDPSPQTAVFRKHLRHNRRLPPSDFRSLH